MLHEFSYGDLTERIRRGLIVRGGLSLNLDDVVSPVVQVADLSREPFQRDVINWCVFITSPALAANNSMVGVKWQGPGVVLVDRITLVSQVAGQLVGVYGSRNLFGAAVAGPLVFNMDSIGNIGTSGAPSSYTLQQVGLLGAKVFGAVLQLGAGAAPFFEPKASLYGAPGFTAELTVEGEAVNQAVSACFQGRYFPNLQPTV